MIVLAMAAAHQNPSIPFDTLDNIAELRRLPSSRRMRVNPELRPPQTRCSCATPSMQPASETIDQPTVSNMPQPGFCSAGVPSLRSGQALTGGFGAEDSTATVP